MSDEKVKVGISGSQFEGDIHAAALQLAPEAAEVVAVASLTPDNAAAFMPARLAATRRFAFWSLRTAQ